MRYLLSRAAISDIANILLWSEQNFGPEAAGRYRTLIDQAFRDVASAAVESDLLQSRALDRPELGQNVGAWHLRRSRDRVVGDKVHAPRHVIIYRRATSYVIIGRLLHDRMDVDRQVNDQSWE